MPSALACERICHTFGQNELAEPVLHDVSLALVSGETTLLMGPSGSGKTTLLSILGCMLRPSSGKLILQGADIDFSDRERLARIRRDRIGFVFQHSQLLPFLTVWYNLDVVGCNANLARRERRQTISEYLNRLDITQLANKYPKELSGGQAQRVAVARALIGRPTVILADEPSAALEWEQGQTVVRLLIEHAQEQGAAVLVVTHDTRLRPLFHRQITLTRGQLAEG